MNDACRLKITIEAGDVAESSYATKIAGVVQDAMRCTDSVRVERHYADGKVRINGPRVADVVIKVIYVGSAP